MSMTRVKEKDEVGVYLKKQKQKKSFSSLFMGSFSGLTVSITRYQYFLFQYLSSDRWPNRQQMTPFSYIIQYVISCTKEAARWFSKSNVSSPKYICVYVNTRSHTGQTSNVKNTSGFANYLCILPDFALIRQRHSFRQLSRWWQCSIHATV